MQYRGLGKTGFKVSVIGLGVEYLKNASVADISKILALAFEEGINYIDLVWTLPNPQNTNPSALLNYTLCQPGVCTAVTGVSSIEEFTADLNLFKASEAEKDYSQLIECVKASE